MEQHGGAVVERPERLWRRPDVDAHPLGQCMRRRPCAEHVGAHVRASGDGSRPARRSAHRAPSPGAGGRARRRGPGAPPAAGRARTRRGRWRWARPPEAPGRPRASRAPATRRTSGAASRGATSRGRRAARTSRRPARSRRLSPSRAAARPPTAPSARPSRSSRRPRGSGAAPGSPARRFRRQRPRTPLSRHAVQPVSDRDGRPLRQRQRPAVSLPRRDDPNLVASGGEAAGVLVRHLRAAHGDADRVGQDERDAHGRGERRAADYPRATPEASGARENRQARCASRASTGNGSGVPTSMRRNSAWSGLRITFVS